MARLEKVVKKKKRKNILHQIVRDKRPEVQALREDYDFTDYLEAALELEPGLDFKKALMEKPGISLIAEVKKASPSAGLIREDFDPVAIARTYEEAGASAISVLTDKKHFQGDVAYLAQIKEAVSLPLLRKDFIIDEYQVVESKLAGADAILLICAILDWRRVLSMMNLTKRLGMTAMVEVHNTRELDIALIAGAEIIGINNRNLETFEVDLETTPKLTAHIHDPIPVVSESGIKKPEDLARLKDSGCCAVLVGETFCRQPDVGQAVKDLFKEEWADR